MPNRGIIVHNRDMRVQYELARQDTEVLKVRIRELKRQLEIEDHNISFGLNDNVHKLELEKELAETEEELKSMQKKLRVLWNAAQETGDAIRKIELGGKMIGFEQIRQKKVMEELGIVRYSLAVDTAVITKIWVPELTTIMKGDPIIQSQSFDLQKSHLSVVGYIPVNKMNRITRNTQVEIFINKDISFTAHVALLGARTEIIPEHLRSNLSKDYAAIVANFRLDPGQILPFWCL